MDRARTEIGEYYDRLARWTRAAGFVGYGGGRRALSVHRALADPRAGGAATATRLHDVIAERLSGRLPRGPRMLDAGCGFGGLMIDLVGRFGGNAVGLTLSRAQAAEAGGALSRSGLADRVRVLVGSYDDPPAGPFDLVVAVESLAHSADPVRSVAALAARLAPGGVFLIVDDMPEPAAERDGDLRRFKAGWRCPVLLGVEGYRAGLAAAGLTVDTIEDLTPGYRPRSLTRLGRLERMNRIVRAVVPLAGWRAVMDSHAGGLALERLYGRGLARYYLIVAAKP